MKQNQLIDFNNKIINDFYINGHDNVVKDTILKFLETLFKIKQISLTDIYLIMMIDHINAKIYEYQDIIRICTLLKQSILNPIIINQSQNIESAAPDDKIIESQFLSNIYMISE